MSVQHTFGIFFSRLLNINKQIYTLNHVLVHCWQLGKGNTMSTLLLKMLPGIILQSIWKAINQAFFEGILMNTQAITSGIRTLIRDIYSANRLTLHLGKLSNECLQFFSFPSSAKRILLQTVIWQPPPHLWFKLNSDGARKANPDDSDAGGVIRDRRVKFVCAYAEAHAMYQD